MTPAQRNRRHKRAMIEPSRELSRRLYEIGRPMNLSVNDVLILIGHALKAEKDRKAQDVETE